MPKNTEQNKDGRWYDVVRPMTKELREQISEVVIKAYKEPI